MLLGDFNVAPEDRDVWSVKAFEGATHVTGPEREKVRGPGGVGLRRHLPGSSTPTTGSTATGTTAGATSTSTAGMRIDLVLATPPVAERVTWAVIDRNARKGKQPSDHTPVVIDVDLD